MVMPNLANFSRILRTNRFDVQISGPVGSLNESLKIESAEIPSLQLVTEVYGEMGVPRKTASSMSFDDVTLTYREIDGFQITNFFTKWINFICDYKGESANQMTFEYYDSYVGNMIIYVYDNNNEPIGKGVFIEAFPLNIGGLSLAQGSSDYGTVSVEIAYRGFTFG